MPVILQPAAWALWLDPDASTERLQRGLAPYPSELLDAYPVRTQVGSYRNDDAKCIRELVRQSVVEHWFENVVVDNEDSDGH